MTIKRLVTSNLVIALAISICVTLINARLPITTAWDSSWTIHTATSLLKEGNTDLDEYIDYSTILSRTHGGWTIINSRGHFYTIFPLGVSLVAVPFVYIFNRFWDLDLTEYYEQIERLIASCIIALCAALIYLLASQFINKIQALLVTFIFSFCTSAWSIGTRALWQHGPSMLFLALTLYLFVLARKKPYLAQFAGITLAFSYLVRPTNIIVIGIFSIFILFSYRKYALYYFFWLTVIIGLFFIHNLNIYGAILPKYYLYRKTGVDAGFFVRLLGHLVSPSRGIFIFSPILLFSILGIYLKIKSAKFGRLDYFVLITMLLYWLAASLIPYWCAGASFGSRYISDIIPFFIYFIIPVIPLIFSRKNKKRMLAGLIFWLFLAFSFFVHYRGATDWEVWKWNWEPNDINYNQERAWNLQDIQFLRGTRLGGNYQSYYPQLKKTMREYKMNERIGLDGYSQAIFVEGWSWPNARYRWSLAKRSVLLLRLKDKEDDCREYALVIHAESLVNQVVSVFLNNRLIGNLTVGNRSKRQSLVFDAGMIRFNQINNITFEAPIIKKPGNGDERTLGIKLLELSIKQCR